MLRRSQERTDRLEQENTRLREALARSVGVHPWVTERGNYFPHCFWCGALQQQHAAECPWLKARELLGNPTHERTSEVWLGRSNLLDEPESEVLLHD